MKALPKIVTIFAKIAEVFCWVGTGLCAASLFVIAIGKETLLKYFTDIQSSTDLTVNGFSVDLTSIDPNMAVRAFVLGFVMLIITLVLMAMICRNIYLIFKTANGETKFSQGKTPFQPDIVRMIREIGIFSIAIPIVEIIMSIVGSFVLGPLGAEFDFSVNMVSVFFGLVVLCLSQFFAYGVQLQKETDGLV